MVVVMVVVMVEVVVVNLMTAVVVAVVVVVVMKSFAVVAMVNLTQIRNFRLFRLWIDHPVIRQDYWNSGRLLLDFLDSCPAPHTWSFLHFPLRRDLLDRQEPKRPNLADSVKTCRR
jgi:hypothetical protein